MFPVNTGNMQRVFLALPIPFEIGQQISGICHGLRQARWIPPEYLHITQQFLGDQSADDIETLCEIMDQIDCSEFEISLQQPCGFVRQNLPVIICLECQPSGRMLELNTQIKNKLRGSGYKTDKRTYHPHATIARLGKVPQDHVHQYLETFRKFKTDEFCITQFSLFESRLHPEGARYTELACFPLA